MNQKNRVPPISTPFLNGSWKKTSGSFANSPKNSFSSKNNTPLMKLDSPTNPPFMNKVSTVPDLIKESDVISKNGIRKITFERFLSSKKTLIDNRARSSSQKRGNKLPIYLDGDELSQKYKKMRVENQEIQIEISKMYDELVCLHKNGKESQKTIDFCLQIITQVFKLNFMGENMQICELLKSILIENIFLNQENILKKNIEKQMKKNYCSSESSWKNITVDLSKKIKEMEYFYEKKILSLLKEKDESSQILMHEKKINSDLKQLLDEQTKSKTEIMTDELKSYKDKINIMEVSLQNLFKENQKLKDESGMQISILTKQKENLESSNEKSKIENLKILNELKIKLEEKEIENQTLKKMKDESLLDFKQCLSKLKSEKDKRKKYEEEISRLMNENQILKVRAAVSFEELTPRPFFSEFKELFGFNEDFDKKTSQEKTQDIFKICQNMGHEKITNCKTKKKRVSKAKCDLNDISLCSFQLIEDDIHVPKSPKENVSRTYLQIPQGGFQKKN